MYFARVVFCFLLYASLAEVEESPAGRDALGSQNVAERHVLANFMITLLTGGCCRKLTKYCVLSSVWFIQLVFSYVVCVKNPLHVQ